MADALVLYGLKTCDTCRKAQKALEAAGRAPTFHDVRADGVSKAQLQEWAKAVGWETLLNTRSTTWRGLDEAAKADIDDAKAIALMLEHPTLIKRPVIESADGVSVGWSKAMQERFVA